MKLIVGLGNPGKEYATTRHNLGFMVLDALAASLGVEFCSSAKWSADLAQTSGDSKVILAKPTTFMNNSGLAVSKLANFYQLTADDIWVVSDDLDLPFGKIRARRGGTSGGHNGLNSIIDQLGTDNFGRLRVGIGQADTPNTQPEAAIFVLQSFAKNEVLEPVVNEACSFLLNAIDSGQLDSHTLITLPHGSAD